MATTYTITIKNKSFAKQSFMLFQSLPRPANLPQDNVFTNVYQRSPQIVGDRDSKAEFKVTTQYWAVYGTSKKSDDGMVQITTSDWREATLGPKGSLFVLGTLNGNDGKPDGVSPDFKSEDKSTAAGGAFTVRTDGTFSVLNPGDIYFGIGAKDPKSGDIIPIQSYRAQPNVISQIFPRIKYYVAFGHYEPGTIVSMAELGQVLEIDFTGAPGHNALFTLDTNNNYEADPKVNQTGIKWKQLESVQ
ncbi:hypothetical protein LX36DRAFT_659223 [Colletotrichum falcatum]|nr:hypothetical protein LX36DRAFT_659223 [Colletotrichum falcatum]